MEVYINNMALANIVAFAAPAFRTWICCTALPESDHYPAGVLFTYLLVAS